MSQEKVNRYKEEKAGRKDTIKKAKRTKMIKSVIYSVVGIVAVGWIGFSVVNTIEENRPRKTYEADYKAVSTYIEGLDKEAE